MSLLASVGWFGVRWWLWFYFLFSVLIGLFIVGYYYRESIKGRYYKLRFPERLVKVYLHYSSNLYTVYWRLIPEDNFFEISGGRYFFDDDSILKENEFFGYKDKKSNITKIKVNGKEYDFESLMQIKPKSGHYAELHYIYNNPKPLNFGLSNEGLTFSAKDMSDFEKNDLFTKLLTLHQERQTLLIVIIICGLNLVATLFIIAKMMGYIG